MGMRCTACGEVNRDEARFCAACGLRITARCTTCDSELLPGARFCDGCGAPVAGAESAGAPVSADVGQQSRKTVTIVFADLQGSTALQEGMDPESVRSLMAGYYAAMREAVDAHAGRVVKFVGDGVMAVFGVPDVAEDDALRAVRAAASMQAAFQPIADAVATQHRTVLALRVGVNTGEVVVDADDADVVGDAVNVASRLESAAAGGDVLVGDETWRLTRHAAHFEPVPALTVKGRTEPVAAHRLVELTDTADAAAAPFVGRTTELSTLRGLFDTVTTTSEPRLATVIGSPGVGKSRLVGELHNALGERATTLVGRVDQTGGATFAPVVDLLRDLGDVYDLVRDDAERDRLVAAIEGLSAGAGAQATPEETFWAVRRLIEIAARTRPVVAVLDDVQWAEPLLLDLIEHLAEWMTAPVLLIAVARPELRELRPALADPHGRVGAVIALEGLDRAATEELARELLDSEDVPALLLERLTAGTDGNPLFVRELVRMLVDDGVVRREGDAWTLAVEAAAVEVPPTIQSLLAARLDRLRAAERTVLERAAVIGAEVYKGALVELVPPEVRVDLDNVLESLRRKELLEPAGTYWIDERVLRFHHALIREAAYRRLLKESRAGLHERVAAWLVAKTGGGADHDETIGYHLEQAQATRRDLGPLDDDARGAAADAADRLGRAARRALDRDDLLAAAGLAERAVNCLDDDDRASGELLLTRCEALLGAGDVAAATPAVEDLARLATGNSRLQAWATCFEVQRTSLVDARALGDAEPRLVDAAAQLSAAGDTAGAAKAHRVHASVLARLGRVGDCEAALDRALGAAREAGDRRQMTSVLSAAPLAALWGPSPVPRAGGRCLDVIRLVRITTGAPAVEATSIRCQAVLEAFRGRLDAARSLIASARAIAEELGLRHGLLEVELFAGIVELCGDDAAAAADHLARAQDGFTAMGVTTDAAQAAALRGRAVFGLGRADEALEHASTSEQLGGQDLKTFIAWRAVKAEVLAARGNIAEATELAHAAVDRAARTDALVDHADALAALASVLRAAGDTAAARRMSDDARALFEQKGATALAARLPAAAPASPASSPAAVTAPSEVEVGALDNTASRAYAAVNQAIISGRPDDGLRYVAAEAIRDDRRTGISYVLAGTAQLGDHVRAVAEMGNERLDARVLARRGDSLAVVETVWHGRFVTPLIAVLRTNAEGHIDLVVNFDVTEAAAAFDELDELYLAQLDDAQARCLRASLAIFGAHNQRDWAGMRDLLAPTIHVVDHRPAGAAEIVSREGFIDYIRAMVDLAPDYALIVRDVIAISDRCLLGDYVSQLTGAADSSYETSRLLLTMFTADGRGSRREAFGPDQLDEAMARFRELSSLDDDTLDGSDRMSHYREGFELALAGRADELATLISPDYVFIDRREGMAGEIRGRQAGLEHLLSLAELGMTSLDIEELATRGDQLALLRATFYANDFTIEIVWISSEDEQGRSTRSVVFDPTDLRAAFEELDNLYIAREGAAHAEGLQLVTDFLHSYNARDWDGVRAFYAPDVVTVDHRPTGFGVQRGVDEVIARHRSLAEVVPDATLVIPSYLAMGPRYWILEMRTFAPRPGADPYELESVTLAELQPAARTISRLEHFTTVDQAWARHRELTEGPPEPERGNTASRVSQFVLNAIVDGRIDDLTSVISQAAVTEDRRVGMTSTVEGFQQFRALAGLGITSIENEVKATRGDRLALSESVWRGDFEVRVLTLVRVDESGLLDFSMLYEPDQLAQAFEELDEQFVIGEGARLAAQLGYVRDFMRRYNARDWDGLRPFYTDDVVSIDRRPAGFGAQHGAHEVIARHRGLGDLAPDAILAVPHIYELGERFWLAELRTLLPGDEGHGYELHSFVVEEVVSPAGPISRIEYFATLDEARSRYDELATTDAPTWGNAAYRAGEVVRRAVLDGTIDQLKPLVSPSMVAEDRRAGMNSRVEGFDQFRALGELGITSIETELLAVRGDRLALTAGVWTGDFEVRLMSIVRLDDAGRVDFVLLYDPDQLVAAFGDLDELHRAGEGAPFADVLATLDATNRAYGERRWADLRSLYADQVVSVDHRPAGFGEERGADPVLARNQAMVEIAPDYHIVVLRHLALDHRGWFGESVAVATGIDGATYDVPRLIIAMLRTPTGPIERFEYFDVEQLDAAWDRWREVAAAPEAVPDNMAVRVSRRMEAALEAKDAAAMDAMFAPDATGNDHRTGVHTGEVDRATMLSVLQYAMDLGVRILITTIATEGDRRALTRDLWSSGAADSLEIEMLTYLEVSDEGLATRFEMFDVDALDEALAVLRRGLSRGSGPAGDENAAMVPLRRWFDAMVRDETTAVADLMLHADFVLEDRRPMFGTRLNGRAAALEWFSATRALGLTGVTVDAIAMRGQRLALVRRSWLARGYELTSLALAEVDDDGLCIWSALYDPDQLDDALDELDERYLAGEGAAHASWLRLPMSVTGAHARRDWDRLRETYAPDFHGVDHRRAGYGEVFGVENLISYHRAMIEVAPTYRQVVRRQLAIENRTVLCELVATSDAPAGEAGPYQGVSLFVTRHRPDGTTFRLDHFDIDQGKEAWARFHELAGEP